MDITTEDIEKMILTGTVGERIEFYVKLALLDAPPFINDQQKRYYADFTPKQIEKVKELRAKGVRGWRKFEDLKNHSLTELEKYTERLNSEIYRYLQKAYYEELITTILNKQPTEIKESLIEDLKLFHTTANKFASVMSSKLPNFNLETKENGFFLEDKEHRELIAIKVGELNESIEAVMDIIAFGKAFIKAKLNYKTPKQELIKHTKLVNYLIDKNKLDLELYKMSFNKRIKLGLNTVKDKEEANLLNVVSLKDVQAENYDKELIERYIKAI